MLYPYFVRIGALAEIHVATALIPYDRGNRVVVRSPRGLQWGTVTGSAETVAPARNESGQEFKILRPVNGNDEILIDRLLRDRPQAIEVCREQLKNSGSASLLLDIDQTLDGERLVLHFLGEIDPAAETIADELAERYESVVQTHRIADALDQGCSTDCGSGGGCSSGCGTSGCGDCGND